RRSPNSKISEKATPLDECDEETAAQRTIGLHRSAPHRAARDRSGETVIAGMRTALPAPEAHSQNPEPTLKRKNRLMVEADSVVGPSDGAAHLQKSLNRSGAISVYLTVC